MKTALSLAQIVEAIESLQGWVSPRLQIRFELTEENLLIFRPDGEKFHSFVELGQLKEQESQRAEQALQELEQEKQRVKALEAFLRKKGIDYDQLG